MQLTGNVDAHMNDAFMTTNYCSMTADSSISSALSSEEGITVEGSDSNQGFQHVYVTDLEAETHVITIKLLGVDSSKVKISQPVTVKMSCPTCGSSTRGKYCGSCGTRIRD